jgi:hypothetical protein
MALGMAGKAQDAIGHFEPALRINPEDVVAHAHPAMAQEKIGKLPEAAVRYGGESARSGIPASKPLSSMYCVNGYSSTVQVLRSTRSRTQNLKE